MVRGEARRSGVSRTLSVMYLTWASGIAATIAVRTTAGATALHVMSPASATSFPMTLVRPMTAAFEHESGRASSPSRQ